MIKINDTPLELRNPDVRDKVFLRLYGRTYKEYIDRKQT